MLNIEKLVVELGLGWQVGGCVLKERGQRVQRRADGGGERFWLWYGSRFGGTWAVGGGW